MASVTCWRCARKVAEAEGSGECAIVVTCKRCGAKIRVDFRPELRLVSTNERRAVVYSTSGRD